LSHPAHNETGARKVHLAILIFLGVLVFGSLGYMILEDASPLTSIYMTVITVSTVGFEEAVQLDDAGRIFTVVLILSGLAATTLLTVTVVAYLVEGEFVRAFRKARMKKRAERMKNHFIICGLGQAGRTVLAEFWQVKASCVAVEKDSDVAESISEHYPGLVMVVGDATTNEMLEAAGVEKARGIVAATESDSDNLLITLTARSMNPDIFITARATRAENYSKLKVAGANHVVMPNEIGGRRMASTLLRPEVIDFLDIIMRGSGEDLRMEQARVPEGSPIIGKTLAEVEIPKRTGLVILAIKRESGKYVFNPTSGEKFQSGDAVIVIGKPDEVPMLQEVLKGER